MITPPRMTNADIKDIVRGIISGHLFVGSQVPPDLLPSVFMPLLFAEKNQIDWDHVGNIIEDISKAGPRSINGYPMFMSCRLIHKDDWAVIADRVLAAQAAINTAVEGA